MTVQDQHETMAEVGMDESAEPVEAGDSDANETKEASPTALTLVAIGRNEGERLIACLDSAKSSNVCQQIVYVDSGSTDGSVEAARARGVEVVELDMSTPFTAARARNAGMKRGFELWPDAEYIQFVDGDCQIADGWLETAMEVLDQNPELGIVCGRRRERFPKGSVYNQLCDIEWDTPVGEARSTGGDAMFRSAALKQVNGYNPTVIAAEDDEVCVRVRAEGWRILRIDHEMTIHDAAIHSIHQWWKRSVRAGHGFAQGYAMHGQPPEKHFSRELRGCLVWGLIAPAVACLLAVPTYGLTILALLLLYALQIVKVTKSVSQRGYTWKEAGAYALNCLGAKYAGMWGAIKYYLKRMSGSQFEIIEYK